MYVAFLQRERWQSTLLVTAAFWIPHSKSGRFSKHQTMLFPRIYNFDVCTIAKRADFHEGINWHFFYFLNIIKWENKSVKFAFFQHIPSLYTKYILYASMHHVSRELPQQLTDVENLSLIIKMNKFRKFFLQPISLQPFIFLLCKMLVIHNVLLLNLLNALSV